MATIAFRPEILQSPASLADFLRGDEESNSIVQDAQRSPTSTFMGQWDLGYFPAALELYHLFASFILTLTSYALHGLCMTDLSKRVWVISQHEQSEGTVFKTQRIFEQNLLVRSVNTHHKETADFFLQQPILFSAPNRSAASELPFFHSRGSCRGMSHWFVYLFFKTLGQIADPQEHVRAVGRQFEQGASRQAAFLQSVKPLDIIYDLLNLNCHENHLRINPQGKTHEQIIGEIQACAPGVYGIYTSTHQMVYIKTAIGQQFFFEPNKGVIKVDFPVLFKKAIESYLERHDYTLDILIDSYSPR